MMDALRFATRALRRTPGTAIVALITIAAAIGVNTAMFSVLDAIVLRPLSYPNAGRIVVLHSNGPDAGVSPWVAHELPSRTRAIELAATYGDGQWTRTGDGAPEVLRGMRVSAGFFDVLG
ncbi:MAG TPA: hypothetical protein VG871_04670, partial [Vicinamibacterales bacterium]|nr:hypothetical protein [Vicinamibacterales bacterium]